MDSLIWHQILKDQFTCIQTCVLLFGHTWKNSEIVVSVGKRHTIASWRILGEITLMLALEDMEFWTTSFCMLLQFG